jgi:hypothetical protein
VLLVSDGKADAAREFIDAANSGFAFPEEKKLLQEALQKQSSSTSATPAPSPTISASTPNPSPH